MASMFAIPFVMCLALRPPEETFLYLTLYGMYVSLRAGVPCSQSDTAGQPDF